MEIQQNKLGFHQRLKDNYFEIGEIFMIKVLFICHGRTVKSCINQEIMGQNGA